jgi:hypothetical protein
MPDLAQFLFSDCLNLKMYSLKYYRISLTSYPTAKCNNPEDLNLHVKRTSSQISIDENWNLLNFLEQLHMIIS